MFDTTKPRTPAGPASAFVVPTERRASRPDIWAEAGHAIEVAYGEPAPIGRALRLAIAIALVVAAKLCAAWVSG